ncbi:MAG: class I SAM-dependent methyltransferase [Acidobacteria bacterium]|nr:class I SAM-dependent methyltransferase [Acidobacteriota bacterium]
MDHIEEYEAVADAYADSMRLPFRNAIEKHTLVEMLGNVTGAKALDMACGDGYYTRLLKRSGASEATGVDVSAEMLRRAEAEEKRNPLGCRYHRSDIAAFEPAEPVDVVVAMYTLGYARTAEQLGGFCRACHDALRPGGRFVGLNDNVMNPPPPTASWEKYGLERSSADPPAEGDVVRYTLINNDGSRFDIQNFYLRRETYEEAFRAAGFGDFRWVDVCLEPSERGNAFWNDFMAHPPIVGFAASR